MEMTVTQHNLEHPPEWLTAAVEYLTHHATKTRITPQTLARKWEEKIGRCRKRRLRIVSGLVCREVHSFKELTQGELAALAEICRWIRQSGDPDEGDAPRWHVGRGPQGAAHP